MTRSSETEIEHTIIGDGVPAIHRREQSARGKVVALAWPPSSAEREKLFESWECAAMRCLREGSSDFAALIAMRKSLRSDGTITATNRELTCAAGCSAKTLEFDLRRLKAAGLTTSAFRSIKGFRGRIRVIRLSLPASDECGG